MNRRTLLKTSSLAITGFSIPSSICSKTDTIPFQESLKGGEPPKYFPNIDPKVISEVVGKSHFDLSRVKELVDIRPELSASVWEWRFGDFESAIGAASHVGRRDIALYLMSKGARPTLFTFAMLGAYGVVKSAIESAPGIQKITGPHGISLLEHAYAGERQKDSMTNEEIKNLEITIDYLTTLGNAHGEDYIEVTGEEQKKYLGNYFYGNNEMDGFRIQINMRSLLSLGPINGFGGALYKVGDNKFIYNGAPSVNISFDIQNSIVKSLTLSEPGFSITAIKVL
jgi:hypothetical protein